MLEKVIPWQRSRYSQLAEEESRSSTEDLLYPNPKTDAALRKLRHARILNLALVAVIVVGVAAFSLDMWPLAKRQQPDITEHCNGPRGRLEKTSH